MRNIRFATEGDLFKLAEIHQNNIVDTYADIYPPEHFIKYDINYRISSWREYLHRLDVRTIVIEDNDGVEGFLSLMLYDHEYQLPLIDRLHVKKETRGSGIGKRLIGAAFLLLENELISDKAIIYCVEGNDRAYGFYKHLGARTIGAKLGEEDVFENRLLLEKPKQILSIKENNLKLGVNYSAILDAIKKPYIIFGVGNFYNRFYSNLGYRYPPTLIFDNNHKIIGKTINNVKISRPYKTDLPVVIAASKYQEIEKQLLDIGYQDIVPYYPWHKYIME